MLRDCRALDLTDEKGFLCGKILADLGADVIKIERPGGDPSRRIGPFWGDIVDPEKSLYWFAYNSNKRGITLNIETADGREIFKKLTKASDFVIESFPPGYMETLGLGYSALREMKDGIILTSITPFGQAGPYRDHQASDIVVMGMAGLLYLTGDKDRPPVNVSIPQACLHGGGDAAAGTMIAYYHRQRTGKGQHVDISMQQSTAWFLATTIPFWELDGVILGRAGTFRTGMSKDVVQRQVWPCKDGYVFYAMLGGLTGAKTARQLVAWMDAEGMGNAYLRSMDWENFDMATVTQEKIDQISNPIREFLRVHTKKEILEEALRRRMSICPLLSMKDLLNDANLKARDFWVEMEYPELKAKIPYPRQFVRSSENLTMTRFRAPLIGEHNEEVYREIGLSRQDLVVLKQAGVI
jgi:crotonobetainyl-CoA:carnitine CoA-transferase CaiB-like acyl-CoA transferase